jgi:hypothetical protein
MTEGLPQLNEHEARVFGVLVEKSMTTPDHYPLTLNAATAGANQKSNRSPQVDWLEAEVDVALQGLVMKGLVGLVSPAGARVEKYRHNGQAMLGIGDAPLAILAELLMRGPQTPGELRGRASRMSSIPTLEDLNEHLEELMARGLARRVAPAPGSRAGRIAQSLVPDLHPVEEGAPSAPAAARPAPSTASAPGLVDRVETLERQVAELRGQLEGLMAELGGPGGRADS